MAKLSSKNKTRQSKSTPLEELPFGLYRISAMEMPNAHFHNAIELNYIWQGQATYLMGGQVVTITAGQLVCFWGVLPHQLIQSQGSLSMTLVVIPLSWFLQWQLADAFQADLLAGQVLSLDPVEKWLPLILKQWAADFLTDDQARRAMVVREVQAYMHRFALNYSQSCRGAATALITGQVGKKVGKKAKRKSNAPVSKVEQLAKLISLHYREQLTVKDLADAVGLHPNYTMELFRSQLGVTINSYLTQQRVSHAQRLLVTTDRGVIDIGLACGFNSVSRFYEAFKKICGQTPRAYRQQIHE